MDRRSFADFPALIRKSRGDAWIVKRPILIRLAPKFYSLRRSSRAIPVRIQICGPIIDAMAAILSASGFRLMSRRTLRRPAVSLVELLVVLFIMGIMLSLLLPALSGARNKANDVKCKNNLRQVQMALSRSISSMKKFPARNRCTIESLRWMEEGPLYDAIKNNTNRNAEYGRPPLFYCPFQEDFPSRVAAVGFCHFVLVVDRPDDPGADRRLVKNVKWEVIDRKLLDEDPEKPEEPWYVGPEMSFARQAAMLANEPGPHTEGKYMTAHGELVP